MKIPAGAVAGNARTFVGVSDSSGKGITSATFRLQGTVADKQPLYIESLAFALAGLPPGEWKLTWSDEFDGKALDTTKWNTGYRFVDVINNELQGYVPENVVVANGICTIKVEKREAGIRSRWPQEADAGICLRRDHHLRQVRAEIRLF